MEVRWIQITSKPKNHNIKSKNTPQKLNPMKSFKKIQILKHNLSNSLD